MKIQKEFVVARPLPVVWDFFHDIPRVATCLPGAEYLGQSETGKQLGKVSVKVGPFQASFEGEAEVRYDEEAKAVRMEGKGVDRKGASRGKMAIHCTLVGDGDSTTVSVDADVQLSGTIAQFGRTGLITEIANVIIADFVKNAEAELAEPAAGEADSQPSVRPEAEKAEPKALGGFSLLMISLRNWIASLLRRLPKKS